MRHNWIKNDSNRIIEYQWKKNKKWNSFKITADLKTSPIKENSETEFITEHYWDYAKINTKTTNEYEVTHPKWNQYYVIKHDINIDFGTVYGDEFNFLNKRTPTSVMLAEGSEITVENKTAHNNNRSKFSRPKGSH